MAGSVYDELPEDTVVFSNPDYESALIGIDVREDRAVYDYDLMVEHLMKQDGMTMEEAVDWVDYNTLGAHTDREPIVIRRFG